MTPTNPPQFTADLLAMIERQALSDLSLIHISEPTRPY